MIKIPQAVYLTLVAISICLVGCGNNSEPSNSDLLTAMGGQYFRVKIPTDFEPDKNWISVAVRKSDGSIKTFSGSQVGPESLGKTIKVFYFKDYSDEHRCTVIYPQGGSSRITLPITNKSSTSFGKQKLYKIGERLIRFSEDHSIRAGEAPKGDDFDLIIHSHKEDVKAPTSKPSSASKDTGDLDPFPESD